MANTIDDYRSELINSILLASSSKEVENLVENTCNKFIEKRTNGYVILRFMVKSLMHLETFHPGEQNCRQWKNICIAKESIYNIKSTLLPQVADH